MDPKTARRLIEDELALLRTRGYEWLRDELLRKPRAREVFDSTGNRYEVEVEAFWDDKPAGDLRVIVSVSGGRFWRTLFPFSDSFIISPTGDFVGE